MNGASSSTNNAAGSGFDLNIVEYFDMLSNSYMEIIQNAVDEVMTEQQKKLRDKAASREEWSEMAETLEVKYDGKNVDYYVNGSREDFSKKEYGDLIDAPKPLLRPFAHRHTSDLAENFTKAMKRSLGESVVETGF
jgi:hypothetical protein